MIIPFYLYDLDNKIELQEGKRLYLSIIKKNISKDKNKLNYFLFYIKII